MDMAKATLEYSSCFLFNNSISIATDEAGNIFDLRLIFKGEKK